jgi:thiol-disulfide isomerase/thioredoxin
MPPERARAALIAGCTVGLLLAVAAPAGSSRRSREPTTGLRTVAFARVPPDFTFDAGSGRERLSTLFDKPVVLNFWASWCHPCTDELDAFAKLAAAYGERIHLLTLSRESPGIARRYLAGQHLELPLAEDPAGRVFDAYSIGAIPVTIVLRPGGAVSWVAVGGLAWPELRNATEAALAGAGSSGPNAEPAAPPAPGGSP